MLQQTSAALVYNLQAKLALYSLARASRRREVYLLQRSILHRTRTERLSTDLRTPHSCIFFPFYPYSIIANFLAVILVPTFCRPKSSQKAQHRQNQSLSSLLRNFASKISFVRRSFAGNFPLKTTGVSNLATLRVSENLPLFSVPFCSRCL